MQNYLRWQIHAQLYERRMNSRKGWPLNFGIWPNSKFVCSLCAQLRCLNINICRLLRDLLYKTIVISPKGIEVCINMYSSVFFYSTIYYKFKVFWKNEIVVRFEKKNKIFSHFDLDFCECINRYPNRTVTPIFFKFSVLNIPKKWGHNV